MLITSLDYSNYVGRIAVGRVHRGTIRGNKDYALCKRDGSIKKVRIKELNVFEGLGRTKVEEVTSGDICALIGIEGFDIGDSITDLENPEPLNPIAIDEPTMSMLFTINNSPFYGQDGKYITSRHIYERLMRELDKNLALRVEETDSPDSWIVYGRGVLHLSILIETMRREGYELQVGQPQVIIKEIGGEKYEPVEHLTVNLPEEIGQQINRHHHTPKGRTDHHGKQGQPDAHGIYYSFTGHHRPEQHRAYPLRWRSRHGTSFFGVSALEGKY